MSLAATRSALRTQLLTVTGLPPMAWENRAFTPTLGTAWAREHHLPAGSQLVSLGGLGGLDGLARDTGIYQITLFYPTNTSAAPAEAMADTVRAAFRPGRALSANGLTLIVERAEVAPAQVEPNWYAIPVSIRYHLHRLNGP